MTLRHELDTIDSSLRLLLGNAQYALTSYERLEVSVPAMADLFVPKLKRGEPRNSKDGPQFDSRPRETDP